LKFPIDVCISKKLPEQSRIYDSMKGNFLVTNNGGKFSKKKSASSGKRFDVGDQKFTWLIYL